MTGVSDTLNSTPLDEIDDAEDWIHIFCPCNPTIMLCGKYDISAVVDDWANSADEDCCPFCLALDDAPCPRCGMNVDDWEIANGE